MSIALEVANIKKSYKKNVILNGVSLNVEKNTIYGLLGLNGAGKSTLLKIISQIISFDGGRIDFLGIDSDSIGFLIEQPAVYGNLTARENLKVQTLRYNLSEQKISEVLVTVGLIDDSKKVKDYSVGMKQRLGIALAILNDPQLLILDEPTNGLDPVGVIEFRDLLQQLKKMGMTIIVSSHSLTEIQHVADKVGIIKNGVIQYEETIENIKDLENTFLKVLANEGGI
ncbi:ABC-2 type transport system ATP-binding protein [Enterococcus rotai]|uniref:Lantibiotic ABC transporter ATP-binding protein n=1 Tax=Enterococcus rotai TaxID=118060 RepID=A0A0U2VFG9_9ENTE|nr:ATP-binding cassette domain-containing protein [Enterococcus rotai]ALS36283.1 lantibiotic ABC transporter ATP-binding protein [Enterococcus rotai]